MKNTVKITLYLLMSILLVFCIVSCSDEDAGTNLWENAAYTSDTTIGNGENTVKVIFTVDQKSITFTINTDKATLGEALYENGLVNDPVFFDVFNGIKADWDKDSAYWAFYAGNEIAPYGIGDKKAVTYGNPSYKIIYTK